MNNYQAETTLEIAEKAQELFRLQRPSTYHTFMVMLREIYNELDPDNDYDLDIG